MVTTAAAYTDERYRAATGLGYDGVVRVGYNGYSGTGTLLYDGQAILTAAHLFGSGSGSATIYFATTDGTVTLQSTDIIVHPAYDASQNNNDVALVWLNGTAPIKAERYTLYRSDDAVGKVFSMVGYGLPGTGSSGADSSSASPPARLKAKNTFDGDGAKLTEELHHQISWTPLAGSQLLADFDSGNAGNDAIGALLGIVGQGVGADEGLISPGDSAGPAFINGQLAGVASYTASLSSSRQHPDVDWTPNSSFGEIGAWQNVSFYQQWIDQTVRAHFDKAPQTASEVQKAVVEGNSGTGLAFFLLEFTGVRKTAAEILSVDYATRNGTATSGQDYLATSGTLKLYPGERQAVIAVEIIGDTIREQDETLFLDVFNPVGGSFGEGIVQLTAVRTIIDDDYWG